MCLLFLYLNDDPEKSDYRLIVANNRDEYWSRPTEPARLRQDNGRWWIGGLDLVGEHFGGAGTWLGLSTAGRFSTMLDILTLPTPHDKRRGPLVKDFVVGSESSKDYMHSLSIEGRRFKPFKMVLIDLSNDPSCVNYFESFNSLSNGPLTFPPGLYRFDNSDDQEQPWEKTVDGGMRFSKIVTEYTRLSQRKGLTEELVGLLADEKCFPDPRQWRQFADAGISTDLEVLQQAGARCYISPKIQAGTRTSTVILVDFYGNCKYVERDLDTPVNVAEPRWTTVKHCVRLDNASTVVKKTSDIRTQSVTELQKQVAEEIHAT